MHMGLYELVKRRCGLIIVCDAEADGDYADRGLGNAVRKCRIDLGIDISLDLKDITPAKSGDPSTAYLALGSIHYENADLNAPTGHVIYIKASLTGDEPTDVNDYKKANRAFPHESTIQQWFTEWQFESCRQLGYQTALTSIRGAHAVATQPETRWWSAAAAAVSEISPLLKGDLSPEEKQTSGETHPEAPLREILEPFDLGGQPPTLATTA